jgi:Uma2 family endonuclease
MHYTYAEYLDVEAHSDVRHEYLDGEIFAMAGGSPEHGFLASRLAQMIGNQLERPCRVGSSDVKITTATGLTTYPDLSVICGPLHRDPRDAQAVTNPILVVEVTSPSTEAYDRGDKLEHYRSISSVRTVLIVAHGERRITMVQRDGDAWTSTEHRTGDAVAVRMPRVSISVDALYDVLDGL